MCVTVFRNDLKKITMTVLNGKTITGIMGNMFVVSDKIITVKVMGKCVGN